MDIAIMFNNVITQLIAKKSLEKNISDQTPILKSHTARSAYSRIFLRDLSPTYFTTFTFIIFVRLRS